MNLHVAIIQAECELIYVAAKVLCAGMMVDAVDTFAALPAAKMASHVSGLRSGLTCFFARLFQQDLYSFARINTTAVSADTITSHFWRRMMKHAGAGLARA